MRKYSCVCVCVAECLFFVFLGIVGSVFDRNYSPEPLMRCTQGFMSDAEGMDLERTTLPEVSCIVIHTMSSRFPRSLAVSCKRMHMIYIYIYIYIYAHTHTRIRMYCVGESVSEQGCI